MEGAVTGTVWAEQLEEVVMEKMGGQSKEGEFWSRHIGPRSTDLQAMLETVGAKSLDSFIERALPKEIRSSIQFALKSFPRALTEAEALKRLRASADKNCVYRSFIGMGYSNCIVPPVIQRNILENPGWYTQYTPYQPEISQGRLEALLNFQTMVVSLTGLEIANASLLDEATAAAEAMYLCHQVSEKRAEKRTKFIVDSDCHPQTIAVVRTRAEALDLEVVVEDLSGTKLPGDAFGVLVQYPASSGKLCDYKKLFATAHELGLLVVCATDLLALALLTSPGELGADVALGSAQRFGVPLGYGGPHAAFFATRFEHQRLMPGRLVGVSKDNQGSPALRLTLQTREQHIRRERATSNICTAQVLLAIMASMYALYHGPNGLKLIAQRVNRMARSFARELKRRGFKLGSDQFFDTVCVEVKASELAAVNARAKRLELNLRQFENCKLGVSFDEVTGQADLIDLLEVFTGKRDPLPNDEPDESIPATLCRKTGFLNEPVFNLYHSETEFLRYVRRLESKDLSLGTAMIPLGSCTMKLNATSEMLPVSWPEFSDLHPFAPTEQTQGYGVLFKELEQSLADITGMAAVSLQPNAGSQGEYAGLLVIRKHFETTGQSERRVCLIPRSAHGTNPASAVLAGLEVVAVECDRSGNVDLEDLALKAEQNSAKLAALMVTYPSTHGVFEESIKKICACVHEHGGQVYMDGANLNALVGLSKPPELGADVLHINLHKTFCIPHGGGGPGMGPIAVAAHLADYLPGHPVIDLGSKHPAGTISAAPWGSALILPISWMYIAMMGAEGLQLATKMAVLNANYIAQRLKDHYPVLYRGASGYVAHECILDLRELKQVGVEVEDVAKRLMDYGFHAPTISWPVAGTMMVEPTESESKQELDRFCDAMISIREEIRAIEKGKLDPKDNPLKNAPHTARSVVSNQWTHPYSRELAAYPAPWLNEYKFWPAVGRVDSAYGDRNLVCTCTAL